MVRRLRRGMTQTIRRILSGASRSLLLLTKGCFLRELPITCPEASICSGSWTGCPCQGTCQGAKGSLE